MALQRPQIIDFVATGASSPGITPTIGSNRIYVIFDIVETSGTGIMTAATIGGVNATLIHQLSNATMNFYAYYIDELGIQAMSGTGTTRTGGATAQSRLKIGIVFQYVNQIEPFLNLLNQGYSGFAQNATGTAPYTLDEIVDGLAVVVGGNSKTTGSWTFNGGYSQYSTTANDGTSMAAVVGTKDTTAIANGILTNLVNSSSTDKICCVAMMLQPGDDGAVPPSDPTSVLNLGNFEGVGSIQTHTVAGGGGVTNQSDVAWSETLQNWLVVVNSSGSIIRYDTSGNYVATITKSGSSTNDIEGITHYQNDEYFLSNESSEVWKVTIDSSTTNVNLQVGSNQSYIFPPRTVSNQSLEGVAVDLANNYMYVVQELSPMKVMRITIPADKADLTAYNYTTDLTVIEPFDPEVLYNGVLSDLASIEFDSVTGNLLLLSQVSNIILEVDAANGDIIDRIILTGFSQPEGLYLGVNNLGQKFLKIWGEPNESQTWMVIVIGGAISLSALSAINSVGQKRIGVAASLSNVTNISNIGRKSSNGSLSIDSIISASISGSKGAGGSLSINGLSSFIVSAAKGSSGSTIADAATNYIISGRKRGLGFSSLSAVTNLAAVGSSKQTGLGTISLSAQSILSANGQKTSNGTLSLNAVLNISTQGMKAGKGFASVSAITNIAISGSKQTQSRGGSVSISTLSLISNDGAKKGFGNTQQQAQSTINFLGRKQSFGNIQLLANGNISLLGISLLFISLDQKNILISSTTNEFIAYSTTNEFLVESATRKFVIEL